MPKHQLGDQPIQDSYRKKMIAIMKTLDEFMNPNRKDKEVGIVILMFPFEGRDGRCNYISNGAAREDIVTLMKEQIARFEGQPEMQGTA